MAVLMDGKDGAEINVLSPLVLSVIDRALRFHRQTAQDGFVFQLCTRR